MQRYYSRTPAVRDAMDHLLLEVGLGEGAGRIKLFFHDFKLVFGVAELLLGQLAFRDAVHAPHPVPVQRAHLPGQPGDRGDDESILRVDVEQVPHVAVRVADAMLGTQPGGLANCDVQRLLQLAEVLVSCGARQARKRRVDGIQASPSKSWTATCSPALTAPRPCSSTMKQLASDIERSTPEPCWPVVRTFHSVSS